jgi:hypothetical protein
VSARRRLKFSDTDEVAADVQSLRTGFTQAGNWNLRQTCWHLTRAFRSSMTPRPGKRSAIKRPIQWAIVRVILTTGRLARGVRAPQRVVPDSDVPEAAIEEFMATLAELKDFSGEFSDHPMLGPLNRNQYMRIHLIHCAHHLSFLTPTGAQG